MLQTSEKKRVEKKGENAYHDKKKKKNQGKTIWIWIPSRPLGNLSLPEWLRIPTQIGNLRWPYPSWHSKISHFAASRIPGYLISWLISNQTNHSSQELPRIQTAGYTIWNASNPLLPSRKVELYSTLLFPLLCYSTFQSRLRNHLHYSTLDFYIFK